MYFKHFRFILVLSYRPTRKNGPVARASFATALLKAGTKSTRDSNLEKTGGAKLKDGSAPASGQPGAVGAEEKKGPVRSVPGHLLQTAGKGLINFNRFTNQREKQLSDEFDEILKPKAPTISFGLYGGHLSVDREKEARSISSRNNSTDEDNFSSSLTTSDLLHSNSRQHTPPSASLVTSSQVNKQPPEQHQQQEQTTESTNTKRVFSNWGGEFFKKNLDYRANTNKIMEKMQLNKATTPVGGAEIHGVVAANGSFGHS